MEIADIDASSREIARPQTWQIYWPPRIFCLRRAHPCALPRTGQAITNSDQSTSYMNRNAFYAMIGL
jgi:hypothetical protein